MADDRQRASPDALLALANKERRGHLKIYLGAAPGVGKTFAMLTGARAAMADGRDVVAGLVETHGRRETAALIEGLEELPRRPIVYRNQMMKEFDLDAALMRKPSLLLVDEYAHTNVPGSRHPKRWQDIEELLDAGIDVWTTLNIQHLESLNDVIQQITKVRVRETVPDAVFEKAGEIVLVDFPPDELLKRLAEGKVYVQDTAARAVESFFKPQNLTALRELALRRAAERIDTDLVSRMQAQAIEGPWAAGERILACIGPDAMSPAVVRAAKRLADLMDAPWIAVTVERPVARPTDAERRRIDEAMQLAQSLGAETQTLIGADVPDEILRFARFENVTQIVLCRARGRFLAELLGRSLPHELLHRADGVAIHFLTSGSDEAARTTRPVPGRPRIDPVHLAWSTLAVTASVAAGHLLALATDFPNVSMVFIVAVLLAAIRFGIWPAIYTSVLSFFSYNFFFTDPLYTFSVARPHEVLALVIFLVVAIMISTLAGRAREQARTATARMRATRRLYEFTRRLSGLASPDDVAEAAASEIHASLARPAVMLLAHDGDLSLAAAWPPEDELDTAATTAARWALNHREPAGAGTATLPTVPWLFLPLVSARGAVGVVGVGGPATDSEARALLDALADQATAALERAALARDMVNVRAAAETERMRNTLLASISHDFRTPLASILGSATSLLDYREEIPPQTRNELLGHIKTEAEGLDEMVRNLLAIARIDAGALELRRDWIDLRDSVNRVANAARRRGTRQTIAIDLPADLPLVRADAALIEQALSNIVGNAIVHTPETTHIAITADVDPGKVALHVNDDGPGIPADMLPRVFDKFVHRRPAESRGGSGLGLAIAKGIMEAHHGWISVESPVTGVHGTRMTLTLPRQDDSETRT